MGAIPKSGLEKSQLRCFSIARSLVQLFLFLTVFCIFYVQVSLVPNLKCGIQRHETFAETRSLYNSDPRGAILGKSRSALRHLRYGKGQFKVQSIGSLAFGGRGVGLLHKTRNWSVVHVSFNSTKGFPGEGWSKRHANFKIATWNTRSMTRERFVC